MAKFALLLLGFAGFASCSITDGVLSTNLANQAGQGAHIRQHDGPRIGTGAPNETDAERTAKHQAWVDHWKNATPEEKAALDTKLKDWKDKHPETPEQKAAREAKHQAWVDHWKNATPEEKAALETKLKDWKTKHPDGVHHPKDAPKPAA